MGRKKGKRYSPKFKFNVVLEVLKTDKSDAEVARAYEVHPVTVSRWKREFLERGAEVFGGSEEVKEYEDRIGQLERMLGQKEVEIALVEIALLASRFPEPYTKRVRVVPPGAVDSASLGPPGRCFHVYSLSHDPSSLCSRYAWLL